MCEQPKSQAQRKKYPGHRACFNHEILSEGFKSEIPEICPNCFQHIARWQIPLIALNFSRSFIQGNRITRAEEDLSQIRELLEEAREITTSEVKQRIENLEKKMDHTIGTELVQIKNLINELMDGIATLKTKG